MRTRIPKLLHYCWFGDGPKSECVRACMASWNTGVFADWELIEWNGTNTDLDFADARDARQAGSWAMIADFARLQAIYSFGGVYLDTDVQVLRPFDALLDHECFLGFQVAKEEDDWVNNAVLGARPGHRFAGPCLEFTLVYRAIYREFARSPAVTTAVLRGFGLDEYGYVVLRDGVTVYPKDAFYPYSWREQFCDECVRPTTYSVHHWEGSWKRNRQG